jgi:ubiquinone/menaquinone biosynthesis C-methylase UbiE
MASAQGADYTFEAFARHDFYRAVNEQLVDATLQIRDRLPQLPPLRALDLACGTGAVTQLLVERLRRSRGPVEVIAVDPSESALEKARRLVGSAVRFIRGGAEAFSNLVPDVDVMLFCNAIHLLPDKDRVLEEARKALNRDGVLGFNTSFYKGCYVEGTERFYKVWMLRSLQLLKQEAGLRPDRAKAEAMQWLSPEEYRALLERHGFVVEDMHTDEALMTCKSWQDISQYSEFAHGALPGVPLDVAVPVLQRSVAQAYHELGIEELPRNWLQVVARAT